MGDDFSLDDGRRVLGELGYFGRGGAIRLADVFRFLGERPAGWPTAIAFGLPTLDLRLPRSVLRRFLRERGIPEAAIDAAFSGVFGES